MTHQIRVTRVKSRRGGERRSYLARAYLTSGRHRWASPRDLTQMKCTLPDSSVIGVTNHSLCCLQLGFCVLSSPEIEQATAATGWLQQPFCSSIFYDSDKSESLNTTANHMTSPGHTHLPDSFWRPQNGHVPTHYTLASAAQASEHTCPHPQQHSAPHRHSSSPRRSSRFPLGKATFVRR